jgi:hypothetical protein
MSGRKLFEETQVLDRAEPIQRSDRLVSCKVLPDSLPIDTGWAQQELHIRRIDQNTTR